MIKKLILCFTFIATLSLTKVNAQTNIFRGKVSQIKPVLNYDGSESKTEKIVKITNQFDQRLDFLMTLDTLGLKDLKNSDNIVVVYNDAYKNNTLVANAIVNDYGFKVAKIETFTDSSLNKDGTLNIATNRTTTVVNINGDLFSGDLANKKVVVFYDQKDIPNSEVLAKKIVVLQNVINPDVVNNDDLNIVSDIYFANLTQEQKDKYNANLNLATVFINFEPSVDTKINRDITGDTLIDLKSVCDTLGLRYNYNDKSGMFSINESHFGFITSSSISSKGNIISLNHPSVLIDDEVYVPLDLFTKVLDCLAYTKNDKVLIYDK